MSGTTGLEPSFMDRSETLVLLPKETAAAAIAETAERERRRTGLAAEADALIRNPAYLREARQVATLMEDLRGSG
jgi:hypothetical protein